MRVSRASCIRALRWFVRGVTSGHDGIGTRTIDLHSELEAICATCGRINLYHGRCPRCGGTQWTPERVYVGLKPR